MLRAKQQEILDQGGVPDYLVDRTYRDIAGIHHWLGDIRAIVRAIARDPLPVRRILDIGCGTGLVAQEVGRRLRVEVVGAELNPHPAIAAPVLIVQADVLNAPLPSADVAFAMYLCHHFSETEFTELIRRVGRFCRRFIVLDLVRHPLPLALFQLFVTPFLSPIAAEDGQRSIRRSFTPPEIGRVTAEALAGGVGSFQLSVAPFYIRQVVDITYSRAAQ